MLNTAYARIENSGQEIYRLAVEWNAAAPEKDAVRVTGSFREAPRALYLASSRGDAIPGDVLNIALDGELLVIDVAPFTTRAAFTLTVGDVSYPSDSFKTLTDTLDDFTYHTEGDVVYRLYTPAAAEKRPMILFLHGGGNGGPADARDNYKQLRADYGVVNFAEQYPDVYVMAPQAKERPFRPGAFSVNRSFRDITPDMDTGWNRDYLAKVCDIIRRMIREGKVDEKRIYVTGMSMGGAGTIRMMSVGADLFAACAPVCPTMTPETYNILRTLRMPVWVSTAYVDHTVYRHKYITDAVMQLKENGHKNAHLTLYSPEELAAYDIAVTPGLTHEQRFSENHASWILTYHDEYGIMSWLLNQVKD